MSPTGSAYNLQAWRGTLLPLCKLCGKQLCWQGQEGKLTWIKASLEARLLKKTAEKPQQALRASWSCRSTTVQVQAKPASTKAPC